jgi:Arylamine N-acetyltransferase
MALTLDKSKLEKYFTRIGLVYADYESKPRDFKMLCELQLAHVTTIPYENLDIIRKIPLSLDEEALYAKIIDNHRGGYCFEVNGLYGSMLRALGFGVTDYFARYLRGETGIPMRRHRVLKVEAADETFMCDIGIGQPAPRYPVKMAVGLHQPQFGETYKFEKEDFFGWVLYDLHNGSWRKTFSFTEEEQVAIDYAAASTWCELHPDSPFNKDVMMAIKTVSGRKSIDGRTFKIFNSITNESENVDVKENLNDDDIKQILAEHFGINYDAIFN